MEILGTQVKCLLIWYRKPRLNKKACVVCVSYRRQLATPCNKMSPKCMDMSILMVAVDQPNDYGQCGYWLAVILIRPYTTVLQYLYATVPLIRLWQDTGWNAVHHLFYILLVKYTAVVWYCHILHFYSYAIYIPTGPSSKIQDDIATGAMHLINSIKPVPIVSPGQL